MSAVNDELGRLLSRSLNRLAEDIDPSRISSDGEILSIPLVLMDGMQQKISANNPLTDGKQRVADARAEMIADMTNPRKRDTRDMRPADNRAILTPAREPGTTGANPTSQEFADGKQRVADAHNAMIADLTNPSKCDAEIEADNAFHRSVADLNA